MMMSRNVEDLNKLLVENERKMANPSLMIEKNELNGLLEISNHYREILPSGIDASRFIQEYEYFESCIDGTDL